MLKQEQMNKKCVRDEFVGLPVCLGKCSKEKPPGWKDFKEITQGNKKEKRKKDEKEM
jgi:hypothetical protein